MKVALCLSGQSRTFKQCFRSQKKHIIDPLNADIFIHTWTFSGHRDIHSTHNHQYDVKKYQNYVNSYKYVTPVTDIIRIYKPKNISVEYPNYNFFINKIKSSKRYGPDDGFNKLFDNNNKYKWFNLLMMYYSIFMSNKLKKQYEDANNFKYDIVIRCRLDLYFKQFIIDHTIQQIIENVIFLPPNEDIDIKFSPVMKEQLVKEGPAYMPNDKLAYGNSLAMDYYSSIYNFFHQDVDYYPHHGEATISDHLWYKNNSIYKNIQVNNKIKMKIYR